MRRRRFLGVLGTLAAGSAWSGAFARAAGAPCPAVERAGTLDEFLFVYDQVAAPHLLREIAAIVRHAPPDAVVHVLVSRARADQAAARLRHFGLEQCRLLVSDEDDVSGDWGRDIFQLACGDPEQRTVRVPWTKSAVDRPGLERGYRQLSRLARADLAVKQLPLAAEGGNLHVDVRDGRRLAFAGATIAVETRQLYRAFYAIDPGDDGVATILRDGLGVDEVVWMGRREGVDLVRQPEFVYHIDLGCVIPVRAVAAVARCDPDALGEDRHRRLLQDEADRTAAALAGRGVGAEDWPEGLDLPADPAGRPAYLDGRLAAERNALREAAAEFEHLAEILAAAGYTIWRLDASPERVRRFLSPTNVIPGRDRLIMPLYPARERVFGWVVRGRHGRDAVDVQLGPSDSDFVLEDDNLAAYRLYRSLQPDVRTVRDYFYLAGGNVHCVIGRLS